MAFRHILLLLFLITFQNATALIPGKYDKLFSVGVNVTKTEYSGDIGSTIFNFKQRSYMYYWGMGSTFSVNLNPSFDVGINGNYGSYGYNSFEGGSNSFFSSSKLDLSTLINYKLDNGYILSRESLFSPFITTGVGFARYSNSVREKGELGSSESPLSYNPGWDLIMPIGAGVQIKFNKTWGLRYQYLYYFTNDDNHDKNTTNKGNDAFGQHLASIVYSFGNFVRNDKCKCDY